MSLVDEVLDFWFGAAEPSLREAWFEPSDAFDQEIRDRFLDHYESAAKGELDAVAATPRGALALVIILDQFPRNLFREDARAYATDRKALNTAQEAIAEGHDTKLNWAERMFLYMPYQHAENLADQERSVELFGALKNENSLQFALTHRDIIKRFGRFPHRNAELGRPSTSEELAFLAEHGRGF